MPADKPLRVAALGASAGGLDAFRTLLTALPADTGMAFILIQHLDPAHASMMVSLLAGYTSMAVAEAGDGMRIERDKIFVIPPGRYLSVADNTLHLSPVSGGRARMPFDFLLESVANAYGPHAICAVLTGTGSDGGFGAQSIHDKGGLVIAQDPDEAQFDGMPRTVIAAGVVDFILPLAKIPEALIHFAQRGTVPFESSRHAFPPGSAFARIIALLRAQTAHDFDLHKRGTLMRRIERRMALARIETPEEYLALLEKEPIEVRNLVDDLFINVTRFFRDPSAFNLLGSQIIPDLVSKQATYNQPIRVWVAGCSTGEEAYSIAILFHEAIAVAKRNIKLTIFASDIDEDAITFAREGLYPSTIETDVSPARLARFFVKEDQGYRVSRLVRDSVVFSVHDLLTDAPFSRIDFVSCCNVLIYLRPEVQQQVLGLFHFALREGGILFLGSAGSVGEAGDRFEAISLKDRIYRHAGHAHPGEVELPIGRGEGARAWLRRTIRRLPVRRPGISELAQRLLLETFAPASVLVNLRNEGVYYFGPTDRYLYLPEGEASQNILATAREGLRSAVRAAIEKATREQARAVITGAPVRRNGDTASVTVTAQPMQSDGEKWVLVSFVDEVKQDETAAALAPAVASDSVRIAQLESELDAARKDLDDAARERETAEEELKAVNEEAMSLNEEFQTTNEELQTSKEELQSLNEELTTLNVQLQETVDREHGIADDLQNILASSDVGTLFLDEALNIRFFSQAARPLFNLIPSDIGRPLADLARNFTDDNLITDAREVLAKFIPLTREVQGPKGTWYVRRIVPYRTRENQIKGVVITFVDIGELKSVERAAASARAYTESLVGEIRGPLLVLDENFLISSASHSFYRLFNTDPTQTVGRSLATLGTGQLAVPGLRRFLELARANAAVVEDYELEIDLPTLGRRTLVFNTIDIPKDAGEKRKILLAIDDITARKRAEAALIDARQVAETANISKSRFLAAASHDLRQPLQTLHLLQGILARKIDNKEIAEVAARIGDTLSAMTGMMDTLLDVSQIEAGVVKPEMTSFPIGDVLARLQVEFTYHAGMRDLLWRVVPCRVVVRSDPRLLEQMLRNLLNNAIKYTEKGKILLGCRRRGNSLRIEVWDTGIGIPEAAVQKIFEEFHQLANPARQAGLGFGLGLAIVQRLGNLLGHAVDVRSWPGRGSVFSIAVPVTPEGQPVAPPATPIAEKGSGQGAVLIVEDDPAVRSSLATLLQAEGYRTAEAEDGEEALALLAGREFVPGLAILDYSLPGGLNGVEIGVRLRGTLGEGFPILMVTGDVSSKVLLDVTRHGFLLVNKPVKAAELLRLLAESLGEQHR